MMIRKIIGAVGGIVILVSTVSTAPMARTPESTHNIPWYEAHPDAAATLLRKCRSDHQFDRSPDCLNAASAETSAHGNDARRRFYTGLARPIFRPRP